VVSAASDRCGPSFTSICATARHGVHRGDRQATARLAAAAASGAPCRTVVPSATQESIMKAKMLIPRMTAALTIACATALPTAQAATDAHGQILTLTPNANETQMTLYWYPVQDDFSPATPCNLRVYTLTLRNDTTTVATYNQNNAPLSGTAGNCFLQKTITSGAVYTSKISPGVWSATARRANKPQISESRTILACTSQQGKIPMYAAYHPVYTDHFYTLSASDRNLALSIGYAYPSTPFAMPAQVRFGSVPFYRYFKGAPQLEHFYTHSTPEWQYVEQNGYVYEGIEGYLFENPKPGAVALYRYTWFNGANGDLMHYYTINGSDPWAAGMAYEGVVGYVCTP
jgi:hypothetical protein